MTEDGWDMSDFLTRYTSKSNQYSSPVQTNGDLFNYSADSDKSPLRVQNLNEVFCTHENLEERLQFLNQELSMLGFAPFMTNKSTSKFCKDVNGNFDIAKLVNCTYELLLRQHHQVKAKDDLEARQIRSDNDNEYLIQNQVRLKQDLENLKREAALLLCREKDQIEKCRILQQEVKIEREEKRKMKADVDHLKKQFYHESKRTEKEITRLKEKVHQLLSGKNQERKIGLDILNSLQRTDGKRSTWKTAGKKHEEEMYKIVISNYEEKEKGLVSENICLRDMFSELQAMLLSLDNSIATETSDEDGLKPYQMPFHLVKTDIETKLKSLIITLKEKLEAKQIKTGTTPTAHHEDSFSPVKQELNDNLLLKLQHYKSIIDGQEKIIQGMKDGYSIEAFEKVLQAFSSTDDDGKVAESRGKLFKEHEKKFNEERKQFTEYVLKIAKEKEAFEKERVEFYMHCLSTPVLNKEKKHRSKAHHGGSSNLRTVTPAFSPAPPSGVHSKIKTPSTADLYQFMSLNYDDGKKLNRTPSFDGSFVQHDATDSARESTPSPQKLQEHADKIRKAVEKRHSLREQTQRSSLDYSS